MVRRSMVLSLLLASCGEGGGAAPTASAAAPSAKRELYKKAQAAFPEGDVPTCTSPVTKPLVLLRATDGGAGGPAVCPKLKFGNEEAWKYHRAGDGDWKEKQILATDTLTLFEVKSEKAPIVGGNLIPGVVEGRVVVFDDDGKPKCQVAVRAEGPDSAFTSEKRRNDDANLRLCEILSAEVKRRLAAPSEAPAAPSTASAEAAPSAPATAVP